MGLIMNETLTGLYSNKVFKYFEEISKIPRGSCNEKQVSNYLVNFAKKRNLEVIQDEALNVIIKKDASNGYENVHPVILQCHMDMVCEKEKNIEHDFTKDPIKLRVDGDYIKAHGTTLGADNGIGAAYILAILDSANINHPRIEALFTTNEEAGMTGASAINPKYLSSKTLISLDAETEGEFLVSCAGGISAKIIIPIENETIPNTYKSYRLVVEGLLGGHSGTDIHLNRGNSNCILGRILNELQKETDIRILNINGGSKDNAIPRESAANVCFESTQLQKALDIVNAIASNIINEHRNSDTGLEIEFEESDIAKEKAFTKETTRKVIDFLMVVPNDINTMSTDIEGLVESSSNLGIVKTTDKVVEYTILIRSSVKSRIRQLLEKINIAARLSGGILRINSEYPELEYRVESKIRRLCENVYEKMYHEKPKIVAIHGGLEGGIFSQKIKDIDIISFAPTMHHLHSPHEELNISSTKRVWEFLLKVLEETRGNL